MVKRRGEAVLPLLALTLFVLLFIVQPLAEVGVLRRPVLGILMLLVVLTGLFSLGTVRRVVVPLVGLGGMVFLLQATVLLWRSDEAAARVDWLNLANDAVAASFLLLLCGLLLGRVMGPGRVTFYRITGAITVYLLITLLFGLLYDLLERLVPGAFQFASRRLEQTSADGHFFYLSTITFTSVGFGDITPVHPFARSLVMIEAVTGHIYTAVLLARLVSLEVADRIESSRS